MITNELIASNRTTASATSLSLDLGDRTGYSVEATFVTHAIKRLTFPAVIGATGGDYVVFYDASGTSWALALNVSGTDPAPTGALWTAVPAARKVNVNISGATTAATVAAAVELAIDALSGLSAVMTTDDSAADGTMLLIMLQTGATTTPVPKNADDTGAGSITAAALTNQQVVGSLKLQGSLGGTYYADIADTTQAVSVTTSSAFLWSMTGAQYRYVRAVWTFTSGFATFAVTSVIKELDIN